jgi:predicted metal-binding protein
MLDYDALIKLAKECGFHYAGPLDVRTLVFKQEVRDMCAADKCEMYNRSWGCPPACGTLDEMREKVKAYSQGLLVQTVARMEDQFDYETMMAAGENQGKNFSKMWKKLRETYPNLLAMGTGGCTKCSKCTYPDEPCRFPDELISSMEACGLVVSEVCQANNFTYYHGPNTVAYTGCFLLE